MEKKYYFVKNGIAYGPVSPEDFLRYGVTPQTMVCPEGGNQWVMAGTLSELSCVFASKPATPPSPSRIAPPPIPQIPSKTPEIHANEEEIEYEFKKTNRMPYIIGAVVGVAIVVLVVVFLVFKPNQKRKPDYSINTTEDSTAVSDMTESEQPEEEVFTGGVGVELAKMAYKGSFFGIKEHNTSSELSSLGGTMSGYQRKVYYNGWRLQIFFDSYTERVTGIAASKDLTGEGQSVYDACREFDYVMDKKCDTAFDQPRTYVTSNGCYASSGYVGNKFYVYFYFPAAPDKRPAPRR